MGKKVRIVDVKTGRECAMKSMPLRGGDRFMINSLGEIFRGSDYVSGSINVCTVAQAVLTKRQWESWKACRTSPYGKRLDRLVSKAADREMDWQARRRLTPEEFKAFKLRK